MNECATEKNWENMKLPIAIYVYFKIYIKTF